MSDYKVSVSNNNIVVDATQTSFKLNVNPVDYSVSLSRTGSQGAKGDTISDVYVNGDNYLTIQLSDSAGNVTDTIAVEDMSVLIAQSDFELNDITDVHAFSAGDGWVLRYSGANNRWESSHLYMNDLGDVTITSPSNGQALVYDTATSKYKNHSLTTRNITDIDTTSEEDGAVLVYNSAISKYRATVELIGGTY